MNELLQKRPLLEPTSLRPSANLEILCVCEIQSSAVGYAICISGLAKDSFQEIVSDFVSYEIRLFSMRRANNKAHPDPNLHAT